MNELYNLSCEIADCGGWEAFHLKRGEYFMYDYFKDRRLKLQLEYKQKKAATCN